jgi:hypothetical protein
MGHEKPPTTEAEWDRWDQDRRYTRKVPLKRDLLAAQALWQDTLNRVIRDGETVIINGEDGQPAAKLVPYRAEPHTRDDPGYPGLRGGVIRNG